MNPSTDNDLISNRVHRHEPPISSELPKIVKKTENYLVVDKPSSMPIHPAAQYRHNSLIFILAREFGINYHVVHRLDRLTSGLVIFAKNKTASQKISKQIQNREVTKQYVCRVVGKFPEKSECSAPLDTVSAKRGINQVPVKE